MGVFSVKMTIWNPARPSMSQDIDAMVDTGASYSWISRSRLEALGLQATRRVTFETIEGRRIERELAPVFVKFNGYTGGDTVVMAEPSDHEVWGALTLESLGLAPDPVKKALVPAVGYALQGGGNRSRRMREDG